MGGGAAAAAATATDACPRAAVAVRFQQLCSILHLWSCVFLADLRCMFVALHQVCTAATMAIATAALQAAHGPIQLQTAEVAALFCCCHRVLLESHPAMSQVLAVLSPNMLTSVGQPAAPPTSMHFGMPPLNPAGQRRF